MKALQGHKSQKADKSDNERNRVNNDRNRYIFSSPQESYLQNAWDDINLMTCTCNLRNTTSEERRNEILKQMLCPKECPRFELPKVLSVNTLDAEKETAYNSKGIAKTCINKLGVETTFSDSPLCPSKSLSTYVESAFNYCCSERDSNTFTVATMGNMGNKNNRCPASFIRKRNIKRGPMEIAAVSNYGTFAAELNRPANATSKRKQKTCASETQEYDATPVEYTCTCNTATETSDTPETPSKSSRLSKSSTIQFCDDVDHDPDCKSVVKSKKSIIKNQYPQDPNKTFIIEPSVSCEDKDNICEPCALRNRINDDTETICDSFRTVDDNKSFVTTCAICKMILESTTLYEICDHCKNALKDLDTKPQDCECSSSGSSVTEPQVSESCTRLTCKFNRGAVSEPQDCDPCLEAPEQCKCNKTAVKQERVSTLQDKEPKDCECSSSKLAVTEPQVSESCTRQICKFIRSACVPSIEARQQCKPNQTAVKQERVRTLQRKEPQDCECSSGKLAVTEPQVSESCTRQTCKFNRSAVIEPQDCVPCTEARKQCKSNITAVKQERLSTLLSREPQDCECSSSKLSVTEPQVSESCTRQTCKFNRSAVIEPQGCVPCIEARQQCKSNKTSVKQERIGTLQSKGPQVSESCTRQTCKFNRSAVTEPQDCVPCTEARQQCKSNITAVKQERVSTLLSREPQDCECSSSKLSVTEPQVSESCTRQTCKFNRSAVGEPQDCHPCIEARQQCKPNKTAVKQERIGTLQSKGPQVPESCTRQTCKFNRSAVIEPQGCVPCIEARQQCKSNKTAVKQEPQDCECSSSKLAVTEPQVSESCTRQTCKFNRSAVSEPQRCDPCIETGQQCTSVKEEQVSTFAVPRSCVKREPTDKSSEYINRVYATPRNKQEKLKVANEKIGPQICEPCAKKAKQDDEDFVKIEAYKTCVKQDKPKIKQEDRIRQEPHITQEKVGNTSSKYKDAECDCKVNKSLNRDCKDCGSTFQIDENQNVCESCKIRVICRELGILRTEKATTTDSYCRNIETQTSKYQPITSRKCKSCNLFFEVNLTEDLCIPCKVKSANKHKPTKQIKEQNEAIETECECDSESELLSECSENDLFCESLPRKVKSASKHKPTEQIKKQNEAIEAECECDSESDSLCECSESDGESSVVNEDTYNCAAEIKNCYEQISRKCLEQSSRLSQAICTCMEQHSKCIRQNYNSPFPGQVVSRTIPCEVYNSRPQRNCVEIFKTKLKDSYESPNRSPSNKSRNFCERGENLPMPRRSCYKYCTPSKSGRIANLTAEVPKNSPDVVFRKSCKILSTASSSSTILYEEESKNRTYHK